MNDPDDGQPWDFSLLAKRIKARKLLRQAKPILLIGSPMCTAFSAWQQLNYAKSQDQEKMRRVHLQACVHLEFVAELYRDQLADGRYSGPLRRDIFRPSATIGGAANAASP